MTKKTDRRVRKTKKLLENTLIQLLKKKNLKDISVRELAETADVNRGTFYLHYKDIYDLFEKIEEEILSEFSNILSKQEKQQQIKWYPVLLDIFRYIYDNSDTFDAVLTTPESTVLPKIVELSRPQSESDWEKLYGNKNKTLYEYYYAFIISGCVAMLRLWLSEGMHESPEYLAALVEKMILSCIRGLL